MLGKWFLNKLRDRLGVVGLCVLVSLWQLYGIKEIEIVSLKP